MMNYNTNEFMLNSLDNLPFVSVIIPVFNDSERLQVCLTALENQTYPKNFYEVIVVDNASEESIDSLIDEFVQARAGFESHTGSYSARNRGLSLAKGEVIAFTDSDCIPAFEWIEKGVANLLRAYNCGIVGGKVEISFKNHVKPTAAELFDSISFFQQKLNVEVAKFSVTANLFTFRKVLDHVGPFNDTLKSGGDVEWGRRVFLSGYRIIYADDARVSHPARNSFGQLYKKLVRVTAGLHELQDQNAYSFMTFLGKLAIAPIKRILSICSDERLNGSIQKIKVIFVMLLFNYIELWKMKQLQLRSKTRRG